MKSKTMLFRLMDNLRGVLKADDYTATIVVTAYLFWDSPSESIAALQRGERRLQEYVIDRVEKFSVVELYPLERGQSIALSPIFEVYAEIYKEHEESREAFANLIAEGIFTGITMPRLGEALDPGSSAELMAAITKSYAPSTVYDGAAGLGRLLYLIDPPRLIARELNSQVAMMVKLLFKMLDRPETVEMGNTLLSKGESHEVDLVVSQPPLGLRISGKEYRNQDYLLTSGNVPSSGGDSLWIQEALYQAKEDGRAILQVAPGWLFRGGYDLSVRKELIERNWLEAIIYLPEQILTNTGIETVLLIFNKGKENSEVTLINAQELGVRKRGRHTLSEEDIQRVVATLNDEVGEAIEDEGFIKKVTIRDIVNNDYDLNRNLYFLKELEFETLSIAEEQMALTAAIERSTTVQNEFIELLEELATDLNRE